MVYDEDLELNYCSLTKEYYTPIGEYMRIVNAPLPPCLYRDNDLELIVKGEDGMASVHNGCRINEGEE